MEQKTREYLDGRWKKFKPGSPRLFFNLAPRSLRATDSMLDYYTHPAFEASARLALKMTRNVVLVSNHNGCLAGV